MQRISAQFLARRIAGHSGRMLLLHCADSDSTGNDPAALPAPLATAAEDGRLVVSRLSAVPERKELAAALDSSPGRVIVVGSDTALSAVMTRLMRTENLEREVAFVTPEAGPATAVHGLPHSDEAAVLALEGSARPANLARDESGQAIVGRAVWRGADRGALDGQVYADSQHVFTGTTLFVELVPMSGEPGVRVATAEKHGLLRRRKWFEARAVQIGTPGILIERDGVLAKRPVKRASMYKHVEPMLLVRP
ncbi:hypothetical protein [Dietzia sp.]|uniref:hypothetical protein n=1 Tax=Dietzia sp. TaxID=1871616 RepID=UPI002FDA03D2